MNLQRLPTEMNSWENEQNEDNFDNFHFKNYVVHNSSDNSSTSSQRNIAYDMLIMEKSVLSATA